MKKSDFITLVLGIVGGLVFGIGMCMCLLPEWSAFTEGVVVTAVGAVLLLGLLIKSLKGKNNGKKTNWKTVGKVAYGIISSLVLGIGMCLIMVWQMMLIGIIVGVVGIILLLSLIPMCIGFKEE